MNIKQFTDESLAHYSYAICSKGEMALIDPSRNPLPYYEYAEAQNAKIVAVFETHPHADFVSGHLQISHETGAKIYVSKKVGATYPHLSFDEGTQIALGSIHLEALNTPGHSPDSICIVAKEAEETAIFTGDTLFVGNVGRPDLREVSGDMHSKRRELAKGMYKSIQQKFSGFKDETLIYPAHGAGSLCGKNMSAEPYSNLGQERKMNWAFKEQSEDEFIDEILKDQPHIPHYFNFNVEMNKKGAKNISEIKAALKLQISTEDNLDDILVIDTRGEEAFKKSHLSGSINIMARNKKQKFESWLGTVLKPHEKFYLVVETVSEISDILKRVAKIGYEEQVKAVLTLKNANLQASDAFSLEDFKKETGNYTIVDIRGKNEVAENKIFASAINIPLNELREKASEIPSSKPIVVHCAGGYRSAVGSSILENAFKKTKIYDLSDAIKKFT